MLNIFKRKSVCYSLFWPFIFWLFCQTLILILKYSKCQFSYSKKIISNSFYLRKYYFNFKSNYFKYLYPNTHFYSNTFKMVNSFYPFHLKWSKWPQWSLPNRLLICLPLTLAFNGNHKHLYNGVYLYYQQFLSLSHWNLPTRLSNW